MPYKDKEVARNYWRDRRRRLLSHPVNGPALKMAEDRYTRKHRQKRLNEGRCDNCGGNRERTDTKRCNKCLTKHRIASMARWRQLRLQTIEAYGGCCACCGEDETGFLTLDHIHNDGAKERKELGGSGRSILIMARLRREGWPKGRYQILCFNCNCARSAYGICPHMLKEGRLF